MRKYVYEVAELDMALLTPDTWDSWPSVRLRSARAMRRGEFRHVEHAARL